MLKEIHTQQPSSTSLLLLLLLLLLRHTIQCVEPGFVPRCKNVIIISMPSKLGNEEEEKEEGKCISVVASVEQKRC